MPGPASSSTATKRKKDTASFLNDSHTAFQRILSPTASFCSNSRKVARVTAHLRNSHSMLLQSCSLANNSKYLRAFRQLSHALPCMHGRVDIVGCVLLVIYKPNVADGHTQHSKTTQRARFSRNLTHCNCSFSLQQTPALHDSDDPRLPRLGPPCMVCKKQHGVQKAAWCAKSSMVL